MVSDDITHQRQSQRKRVGGHLADAVVRRIGDPYAMPSAARRVDRVEARADAAHDAELRQRGADAVRDRRLLEQHAGAIPRGRDDVVLGLALRDRDLDSGCGE